MVVQRENVGHMHVFYQNRGDLFSVYHMPKPLLHASENNKNV